MQSSNFHTRFILASHNSVWFFALLTALVDQLYAKEVYFCSYVTKSNLACTLYSLKSIQQFPQGRRTWKVSQDFHYPLPYSLHTMLPHIFTCIPIFFFIRHACRRKFFRAGKVSLSLGTFIKILSNIFILQNQGNSFPVFGKEQGRHTLPPSYTPFLTLQTPSKN